MQPTILDIREQQFTGQTNQLPQATNPDFAGAQAALNSFYYALNSSDLEVLDQVWLPHELIQVNNPLGGITRGATAIHDLYSRIMKGRVRVRVMFTDAIAFITPTAVVFAGREEGTYVVNGRETPLHIRTTRAFVFSAEHKGWRQVHHHGSIDDAAELLAYQQAIKNQ